MTNEEAINELLQCYSLYSPFKTAKKTNEAISMAIDALAKDINAPSKSALDHIHNVVRDDAYKRGYEQGKAEKVPAIPLAWIDGYIQTCNIFDLRANVPASEVIKTMLKIWGQETQGK